MLKLFQSNWTRLIFFTALFFIYYSFPLWGYLPPKSSLTESMGLNHERIPMFFEEERISFSAYSIGATFLDWSFIRPLLPELDSNNIKEYHWKATRLSAWLHCLLAALAPLFLFLMMPSQIEQRYRWFAFFVLGINPSIVFLACTASVNIPFFVFGLVSLFCLKKWMDTPRLFWAILAGLFSAVAFVYKELFGFMMLAYPLLIWMGCRGRKVSFFAVRELIRSAIGFAVFVGTVYLLSFEWLHVGVYTQHIVAFLSGNADKMGEFRFATWKPSLTNFFFLFAKENLSFPLAVQSFPVAFLALFGILSEIHIRKTVIPVLLLPALTYFLFVLVLFNIHIYHYHLPLLPYLTIVAALGLQGLIKNSNLTLRFLGKLLMVLSILGLIVGNICLHHDMATNSKDDLVSFLQNFDEQWQIRENGFGILEWRKAPPDFLGSIPMIPLLLSDFDQKPYKGPVPIYLVIAEPALESLKEKRFDSNHALPDNFPKLIELDENAHYRLIKIAGKKQWLRTAQKIDFRARYFLYEKYP